MTDLIIVVKDIPVLSDIALKIAAADLRESIGCPDNPVEILRTEKVSLNIPRSENKEETI